MIQKFTPIQKERVDRLERALKIAATNGNLEDAKKIVIDLKPIFEATGNSARLLQAKTRYYEAAMEAGNVNSAIQGIIGIRSKINKNTRTHLEATALLAICYLRIRDVIKAEPYIREVLINDNVITSTEKRNEFRKSIIERFDEEGLLYSLRNDDVDLNDVDYNEIESEVGNLIRMNYNEDELFESIGKTIPDSSKNILLHIDSFSKKQLPSAERLLLPSGLEMIENKKVGKTVFSSVKRVLYKSLCDKDSEIHIGFYSKGIASIASSITVVVSDVLKKFNLTTRAILIGVIALIIQFGISIYCEHYKPIEIMELR